MGKVIYNDRNYELEPLRKRMGQDLAGEIDGDFSDQEFFDSYIDAHNEKYGERFVVD